MGISLGDDRYYRKWIGFVNDVFCCLNIKYNEGNVIANWQHLPSEGGYYNQDPEIMNIWEMIRNEIINSLMDSEFINSLRVKHGKNQS
jgi:hypothetical protein